MRSDTQMTQTETLVKATQSWWENLDYSPGDRSRLRRCGQIQDALMIAATHDLSHRLTPLGLSSLKRTALLAAITAQVRTPIQGGETMAAMLGAPGGNGPKFSEVRFRRLLRSANEDDLLLQLRRAVSMLGNSCHLPSLVETIRYWSFEPSKGSNITNQWAYDYYKAFPRQKTN